MPADISRCRPASQPLARGPIFIGFNFKLPTFMIWLQNKLSHKGHQSYNQLNQTIMVSKKAWLAEALERNIEVLIYNGNLDVIVNVPGTNR